jgi:hypothetical protein
MERDVVMDKNAFIKLLKEKKLVETLMQDEDFKNKAKKILKEENKGNADITDKDLINILKDTEKALSGNVKIENEADLDEVSGGSFASVCKDVGRSIARGTIKTSCTAASAIGTGLALYGCCGEDIKPNTPADNLCGTLVMGAGATGYGLGTLISYALGLED